MAAAATVAPVEQCPNETCSESDGEEEPNKCLSLRIKKLPKGVTVGIEKKDDVVGRLIHEVALKSGMDLDCYVCAAIVDMYAKCGEIGDAYKLFDGMPERDLVTWTVMIGSYADSGR